MDESNFPNSATHKNEPADFFEIAAALQEKFTNYGYELGEYDKFDNNNLHLRLEINKTVVVAPIYVPPAVVRITSS